MADNCGIWASGKTKSAASAKWNRRREILSEAARYRAALRIANRFCEAVGQCDEEKVAALAIEIAADIDAASKPVEL